MVDAVVVKSVVAVAMGAVVVAAAYKAVRRVDGRSVHRSVRVHIAETLVEHN